LKRWRPWSRSWHPTHRLQSLSAALHSLESIEREGSDWVWLPRSGLVVWRVVLKKAACLWCIDILLC
jgi:hypothetical protein